jgi:hypothetical protein
MAGEADQAAREFGKLFGRGRAFAFFGAQLHAGDQAAEVLIALACGRQQRVGVAVGAGDFRTDMGADAGLLRRHVKARRAVDAVAVHQRHGGQSDCAQAPASSSGTEAPSRKLKFHVHGERCLTRALT